MKVWGIKMSKLTVKPALHLLLAYAELFFVGKWQPLKYKDTKWNGMYKIIDFELVKLIIKPTL